MLDFLITVGTAITANAIVRSSGKSGKPYKLPQHALDFYENVLDKDLEFSIKRERVEDHPEYYEWARDIAIKVLGLPEEKANEKYKVGKHLPLMEYPLNYVDEIMLYHGKLSTNLAYGGLELPSEVYGLKFTEERWNKVVDLANNVNGILKEHGIDEKLVVSFYPYRNKDEFRNLKIPILFYLSEIDFGFFLDLYMHYGQVGKTVGKISWESQNIITPARKGEKRANVI